MTTTVTATDSQPVAGATLADLDAALIQRHIAVAKERGRYTGSAEPRDYLLNHRAVVDANGALVPTIAGMLIFNPAPERFLSASGVDIAQFSGKAPRATDIRLMERVRGPLSSVIDQAVQILWLRSDHGYRIEGAQRLEEHAYPEVVLRELTVNALCHRDWLQESSRVRIQMFTHAIEWISPGTLPPGVTVSNLRTAQVSRNRALAQLLYHGGYVEEFGIGLDTVFDTLRDERHEPPWMDDDGSFFTFRVNGKPITRQAQPRTLANLSERQQRVLEAVEQRGGLTISDLVSSLPFPRRTIQYDLQQLVDRGYLVATGATNNRRYLPAPSEA